MAYSMTVPTIGVLALGGAALGMHLGEISVAEINPIYFQEPPTRFHADLAAYQSPTSGGYDARMDATAPIELGTGCVGCRTYPEEYYPVHDPAVDRIGEEVGTQRAPVVLASAETVAPAERDPALDRLQRYSQFAVAAEEPQAPPSTTVENEASAVQGDEIASAR
jgi:hypothetical protein